MTETPEYTEEVVSTQETPAEAEPEQPRYVSTMVTVSAPDGTPFDVWRNSSPEKIANIGQAIADVRKLVQDTLTKPEEAEELGNILKGLASGGYVAAEYRLSWTVDHIKNLDLKTKVVKRVIEMWQAEENHSAIVNLLVLADAAQLALPEFGMEYMQQQYDTLIANKDYSGAYLHASTLARNFKSVLAMTSEEHEKNKALWKQRQVDVMFMVAEQVVEKAGESELDVYTLDQELRNAFNGLQIFYNEGTLTEDPFQTEIGKWLALETIFCSIIIGGPERASWLFDAAKIPSICVEKLSALIQDSVTTSKIQGVNQDLDAVVAQSDFDPNLQPYQSVLRRAQEVLKSILAPIEKVAASPSVKIDELKQLNYQDFMKLTNTQEFFNTWTKQLVTEPTMFAHLIKELDTDKLLFLSSCKYLTKWVEDLAAPEELTISTDDAIQFIMYCKQQPRPHLGLGRLVIESTLGNGTTFIKSLAKKSE